MSEVPPNETPLTPNGHPDQPPERTERANPERDTSREPAEAPQRHGPFGPLSATESNDPNAADERATPTSGSGSDADPYPRQMPMHMHDPTAPTSARRPEPPGTTGVPHYSPPASTDRLFGGPAATAAAPRQRSVFRPLGRGLREIAETIILALLIFLLVRAVVQNFQVEGSSMNPTFENQWYVLVNKALYWEINLDTVHKFVPFVEPGDDPTRYVFRGPKRGDVIVFRSPTIPDDAPERDFIKRIIALPGETVEIHDCTVFVDGLPLDEPYIKEPPRYEHGPETVPPDHYFVLGDNRNNSSDSKNWGPLPKENIIGQAWLIYWPRSAFGLVDNTSVTPEEPEPLTGPFEGLSPNRCPGS